MLRCPGGDAGPDCCSWYSSCAREDWSSKSHRQRQRLVMPVSKTLWQPAAGIERTNKASLGLQASVGQLSSARPSSLLSLVESAARGTRQLAHLAQAGLSCALALLVRLLVWQRVRHSVVCCLLRAWHILHLLVFSPVHVLSLRGRRHARTGLHVILQQQSACLRS